MGPLKSGAGDRTRTDDIDLGKVAFYQLNYARVGAIMLHFGGNLQAFFQPFGGFQRPLKGLNSVNVGVTGGARTHDPRDHNPVL